MSVQSQRSPAATTAVAAEVGSEAAIPEASNADANASLAAAREQGLVSEADEEGVLASFAAGEAVGSKSDGVVPGVVDAARALEAALATGDDAEILAALATLDAALDAAEADGADKAISEATGIAWLARGKKTKGTKAAYDELLFRMSGLREAREAKQAQKENDEMHAEAAARSKEEQSRRIAEMDPRVGARVTLILDQREAHEEAFLDARGGRWTADLIVKYATEYPTTPAEYGAMALAQDWPLAMATLCEGAELEEERVRAVWSSREIKHVPPTKIDRKAVPQTGFPRMAGVTAMDVFVDDASR